MTGVIIRRDEDEFARYLKRNNGKAAEALEKRGLDARALLNTEVGFLAALCRFKGEPLELDAFQVRMLACRAPFRSLLKARQIGYSFGMAAEMLARAHLRDRHVAVCLSYNLDDAKEKISLIKELHDELPLAYQKRMVIDSKTEVAFESRLSKRRISRIHSFPSKAPRGKSGDVYIDEFAHCLNDKLIYAGATAVTIRAEGQLTVGSTPFGKRGMFYRIHVGGDSADRREFGIFWRSDVPWWLCRQFCRDVEAAAPVAQGLETEDRVKQFGTLKLLNQFGSNAIDDFRQEFELEFQDERATFFPIDLVAPCCQKDPGEKDTKETIQTFDSIEELALEAGNMGPLYAGYDVGRTKHPSELFILEERKGKFVQRYVENFLDEPFQVQFDRLSHILDVLGPHLRALRIDKTGIGWNLSENLRKKYGAKIEEWIFTNQIKIELANNLKILFENKEVELLNDRKLRSQLGSIRQKITEAGNTIFDVVATASEKHHADKVWALALAAWRKRPKKYSPVDVGVRILGEPRPDAKPGAPPAAPLPRTQPPISQKDVDSIFEVPEKTFVPRRPEFAPDPAVTAVLEGKGTEEHMRNSPTPVLERRSRMVKLSLSAWERSGQADQVTAGLAELEMLADELASR